MADFLITGSSPWDVDSRQQSWTQHFANQANTAADRSLRAGALEQAARERVAADRENARRFAIQQRAAQDEIARTMERQQFTDRYTMEQARLKRADELAAEARKESWKERIDLPQAQSEIAKNLRQMQPGEINRELYRDQFIEDQGKAGLIDSPAEAIKLGATPERAEMIARRSQWVRREKEAEAAQAEGIADTLNKLQRAEVAYRANQDDPAAKKAYTDLFSERERLKRDKSGLMDYVTPDKTGTYRSHYPIPWRTTTVGPPGAPGAGKPPPGAAALRELAPPKIRRKTVGMFPTFNLRDFLPGSSLPGGGRVITPEFEVVPTPGARPTAGPVSKYRTADEVVDAVDRGDLSEAAAEEILKGM